MATQPNQPQLGLMATQPKSTGAPKTNVGQNKTQPYQAQTYNVNPQALVENRVAGLMSQDSEAMKIARENAQRLSASRGLQSSSIATENAMNAMFNFATPIAQQDANTIATQDLTNQSMQHDVGMANLGADNQIRVNQQQQGFQASESALDRALQSTLQSNQFDFTANQNQMDRQQQTDLQNSQFDFTRGESALDRAFQQSMQNDSQSFTAEQNQLDRTQQTNLQNDQQAFVSGESALDRTLQQTLQSDAQQFTADQANLDRNLQRELQDLQYQQSLGLLDAEGQQRLRELEAQFANDQAMLDQQNAFTASQSELDRNLTRELQDLQYQQSLGLLDAEGKQRLIELEAQFKNEQALQSSQNEFIASQSSLDRNLQRELQDLQYQQSLGLLSAEGQQRLKELDAQFRNEQAMQANQNAFIASQSELDRNQQAALQNDAQAFTSEQSTLDRNLTRELQDLQYQQSLGLLSAEGEQRLTELEAQFGNQQALQNDAQQFTAQQANADRNFTANQSAADRALQERLQSSQNAFTAEQSSLDRQQQASLQNDAQQFTAQQANADRNFTKNQNAADRNLQTSLQSSQQAFQSEMQAQDYQNQQGLMQTQNDFAAGQAELDRTQQTELQQSQNQFAAQQANADRNFTKNQNAADRNLQQILQNDQQAFSRELQELQYEQQQGLLDQEGQQRLQEMEVQNEYANAQIDRQAQIQTERDSLLQSFAQANMSQEQLYNLEQIATQFQNQVDITNMQNDYALRLEASNSVANVINEAMASLGNAMMNPEIDAQTFAQMQTNVQAMLNDQIRTINDIYGSSNDGVALPGSPTQGLFPIGGNTPGTGNSDIAAPDVGLMQPNPSDIAQQVGNNGNYDPRWFDQQGNYIGA